MGLGEVKRQKIEKELCNIQRAKSKVGGASRKPLLCEIQPSVSQAGRSTWTKYESKHGEHTAVQRQDPSPTQKDWQGERR